MRVGIHIRYWKIVFGVLGIIASIYLSFVVLANSRLRIWHEHGVWVARPVWNIHCSGDAWFKVFDRTAYAAFNIRKEDYAALKKAITVRKTILPLRSDIYEPLDKCSQMWELGTEQIYFIDPSKMSLPIELCTMVRPWELLVCRSETGGDWLVVAVFEESDALLILMWTDWN